MTDHAARPAASFSRREAFASQIFAADPADRAKLRDSLPLAELEQLWEWWARREQLHPPYDEPWLEWVVQAGRGWGKTRTGAEFLADRAVEGTMRRGAMVGTNAAHVRDVMVEGDSGLGQVCERRKLRFLYEPSKTRVTLQPTTGRHSRVTIETYSAEKPDNLAGPQQDTGWCDEPGSWAPVTDGAGRTVYDNLMFGLRLGDPRVLFTGTPRPRELIRQWMRDDRQVANGGRVHLTTGTIWDNAGNLAPTFLESIVETYAGTRLGDQELLGLLLDNLGSYFHRRWFSERVADPRAWAVHLGEHPELIGVRYWDLAHARESERNPDPDWTAGVRVWWDAPSARWVWDDLRMVRGTPAEVEQLVLDTAREDGGQVQCWLEQTPGAGAALMAHFRDDVLGPAGIVAHGDPVRGKKEERAEFPSAKAEQGRLWLVDGAWNKAALDQLESFPEGSHDDVVDALSGAFKVLRQASRQVGQTSGRQVAQARIGGVGAGSGGLLRSS